MIKGFFGFEIFNLGIFLGRKILASIFWGSLVYTLSRVFGGIHNNPKIVIVPTYAQPRSAMNKVKPNLLCACLCFLEIFMAWKFSMGFFGGLNFGPGIFLGFDFCLQSIILVTWSPEYSPGSLPHPLQAMLCCCTVRATSKLYSNKHHNIEWWGEGRRADCFCPQEPHLKTVCQHFVSDCSLLKLSPPQRFECQNVFHEHWLRQRQMQITFFRRFWVEK